MSDRDKLHAAIMNLPCKYEIAWQAPNPSSWVEGYVNGHRDTRHAAAELVSAAWSARDSEVERLREALRGLLALPVASSELAYLDRGIGTATQNAAWLRARAALFSQDKESA